MAKLGEVCDFYAGTGFPNEYQGRVAGKYPFYKVGDISKNVLEGNRELKICANYVDEEVVQKLKGSILPPKTIVFAKIGEALKLNRRAITSCECLVDNNVMGVKAQNGRLNDEYLFYWLQNLNLSDYSESTTVPSVKKSRLQNIEINVSPLEEQEKVASTLNKLSSLILARKKQLSKLDELVKARFVEMFGERSSIRPQKLKEVTRRVKVGFVGTCEKYYTDNTGVPMLRTTNITSHGIDLKDLKYVTITFHEKNLKSRVHKGDLLIARHGSNGQANVYCGDEAQCLNAIIIEPDHNITNPIFLENLINSRSVKRQIEKELVGSTQHVLNTTTLANVEVKIPAIKEQQVFAAFVERVDQQKQTVQQSLEKLELMKKALMQEYFG